MSEARGGNSPPPIFSCFWLFFFQNWNVYFFTFKYIEKLPKLKEHRLKSKSMWFGEEKKLVGGCFYNGPAGGEFSPLTSYID